MLDPRESQFWQSAIRSGLMDAGRLSACWDAIDPSKRDDPERLDRRLARRAVETGRLTLWQAQQLLAGRYSGYMVDRYRLLDVVGQGGMGRVYLAQDTRLDRHVALKILSPERLNNPRAVARFEREARIGARLQHENLVRIYDFGESAGRYYLVMEYIEGQTIAALMDQRGPVPPVTAARLIRQVAWGLGHAHGKGMIHRDVNPYNILVTHEGTAKLADMGLAVILDDEQARITRDGATVGTFDYVAPEQARDSRAADTRSDIYSLGCTMYHMCCGEVPFPGPTLPEKVLGHQTIDPVPLSRRVPGFPEGLGEVVRRMMRKAPADRYATPADVAAALAPYCGEPTTPTAGEATSRVAFPLGYEPRPTVGHGSGRPGPRLAGAPVRAAWRAAPAAAAVEPDPAGLIVDSPASLLTPDDDYDPASDADRPVLTPDPEPVPVGRRPGPGRRPPTDDRASGSLGAEMAGWPIRVRRWLGSWWR